MVESIPNDAAPGRVECKMTMTLNEKESRVLIPSKTGDRLFGRISKHRAYWWAVEPAQLCFLNRWSPEDYLKKVDQVAVDGTEVIDGVETIRIAWQWQSAGPEAPGAVRKGLFWVQPSRGHAVGAQRRAREGGRGISVVALHAQGVEEHEEDWRYLASGGKSVTERSRTTPIEPPKSNTNCPLPSRTGKSTNTWPRACSSCGSPIRPG